MVTPRSGISVTYFILSLGVLCPNLGRKPENWQEIASLAIYVRTLIIIIVKFLLFPFLCIQLWFTHVTEWHAI